MYCIDWAVKKKLQIYHIETDKLISIPPSTKEFKKFLETVRKGELFAMEAGGGDTYKLIIYRKGHRIFIIAGKRTNEYGEELGIEKSDKNDAGIILPRMWQEIRDEFREFKEIDALTATIKVLSRRRQDVVDEKVKKKNQLQAFAITYEAMDLDGFKEKDMELQEANIKVLEQEIKLRERVMLRKLKEHPVWTKHLKDVKGAGVAIAGRIIGEIGRASDFPTKYNLRSYAREVPLKGKTDGNRRLKMALRDFTEEVERKQTAPEWRELYDSNKIRLENKHPDWRKFKIRDESKKQVAIKFLDEVYGKMIEIEKDAKETMH